MIAWMGQMLVVIGFAVLLAVGHRVIGGSLPDPIACVPEKMQEGYICYQTISKDTDVVWVDARARKDYDAGHLEGAILLNNDPKEDFEAMFLENFAVFAQAGKIVVYCGKSGCKASEEVAMLLSDKDMMIDIKILYGGVKTLQREGLIQ